MRIRSRHLASSSASAINDRVAAERLRANHDARPAHERFIEKTQAVQATLIRAGKRIVEKPEKTCPECLYDLTGTDREHSIGPCPECGCNISGPAAALVWSQDAIRSRRCMFSSILLIPALVGATLGFGMLGMKYLPALVYVAMFFYYFAMVCVFAVPYWAWKWRRLRRPRGSKAAAGAVAAVVMLVNLVVFMFAILIA